MEYVLILKPCVLWYPNDGDDFPHSGGNWVHAYLGYLLLFHIAGSCVVNKEEFLHGGLQPHIHFLSVSSSSRKPSDEIARMLSQAPDSLVKQVKRQQDLC